MRGRPYYEEPEFHDYLLSRERRDLFPVRSLLSQIKWEGVENLLDFGSGNGYFLRGLLEVLPENASVWGAECQEDLIDYCLSQKVKEGIERFTPFYTERTEHPLLPDWLPEFDMAFCACVLSTFADPAMAIRGVGRSVKNDGRMIILDWERVEAPSGPEIGQKVSKDRMLFFVRDAGYRLVRTLKANSYTYLLEIEKGDEAREEHDRYSRLELPN
ncbi:MAG: class I SAM-dependent methyltransferase [Leptospirales bacterium]|nr:class I SAM-dependent methyltransferase [Leptospirales bacterium]